MPPLTFGQNYGLQSSGERRVFQNIDHRWLETQGGRTILFPIAIERGDEEHAYGVVVPDLPGCFSAGDTFEEALANVREAIEGWLEVAVDHGDPIPQGQKIELHADNPDFEGWTWKVIDIDVNPYLARTESS